MFCEKIELAILRQETVRRIRVNLSWSICYCGRICVNSGSTSILVKNVSISLVSSRTGAIDHEERRKHGGGRSAVKCSALLVCTQRHKKVVSNFMGTSFTVICRPAPRARMIVYRYPGRFIVVYCHLRTDA